MYVSALERSVRGRGTYLAVLVPFLILELFHGSDDGIETHAVRAVRIRQIAGAVDLVRLDGIDQILHDVDVLPAQWLLLDLARFVEGQMKVVNVIGLERTCNLARCSCIRSKGCEHLHATVASSAPSLGLADEALDLLDLLTVGLGS